VLVRAGFDVTTATSISEAGEELARVTPQAILVELMLGADSGLDLLRSLRQRGFVGALVGMSGDELEAEALSAGAQAFLLKPFSPTQLITCVEGLVPTAA
jgi:DNA-binding response OmpR family regulator